MSFMDCFDRAKQEKKLMNASPNIQAGHSAIDDGHGYGDDRGLGEGIDYASNKNQKSPVSSDALLEAIHMLINGDFDEFITKTANLPVNLIRNPVDMAREKAVVSVDLNKENIRIPNDIDLQFKLGRQYVSMTPIQKRRLALDRKIITLCGSSKFKTEFERVQKQLSYDNNCIVLSLDFFTKSENLFYDNKETKELAESKLRETHLAKISISDEIYVINKDGYIGQSTSKEIEYAKSLGIPVKYLEPLELLDYNPDHTFKKGTVVKHFKRELLSEYDKKYTSKYLYLIEGTAMHTENGEELVIYKSLSEDMKIYARPASMFYGLVDKEKYPDIKQKYRFEEYIKD